jgi:SulP family sulfate permease
VSERRGLQRWPALLVAGLTIGTIGAVVAVGFGAFVFGGYLHYFLGDGIGLYLGAAAVTFAVMAWRAGRRGLIGELQAVGVAVVSLVVVTAAGHARGSFLPGFLTAVAATMVVTVLCGVVFLVLGVRRRGNLVRFIPYPVVGGFLAGAGWLLLRGGVHVASNDPPDFTPIADLFESNELRLWLPALAFGVILLLAVRFVRRPLTIPVVIGGALVVFVIVVLVTGSSLGDVRRGGWLLGPFETTRLWQPWTLRALGGADWLAVLESWAGIVTAVFVAAISILFNISGSELILDRDLDTNEELRDAGVLNVISGALGGIPGYHALSLTALAERMKVDARAAGLIAALVPLAAVVFGASVVGLIPRLIVGGVLVFLGLSFMVEWVWDKRRTLPTIEYVVVLVILATIIARGFLPGVVLGLVLAVVLFAISYGRVELVHEVAFGPTYHSNVDRPPEERAALRALGDRVQILRVSGFVFFGSTNRLLERIRERVETDPPRFLVIDLLRVTGVDSSAVVSFVKAMRLAEAHGFEIVLTGASERVRRQLERGGVVPTEGVLGFEPDLDRGLQRCEDALLATAGPSGGPVAELDGLPPGLEAFLERVDVPAGTVLLHQDDPPGDVFVLASGHLGIETVTPEGTRIRLRSVRPGVVVGEVALYTGVPRTADVVAEVPSVVLRFSRDSIARMEAEQPELAAALHRWLAGTLAQRLSDTMRTFDALLDQGANGG